MKKKLLKENIVKLMQSKHSWSMKVFPELTTTISFSLHNYSHVHFPSCLIGLADLSKCKKKE